MDLEKKFDKMIFHTQCEKEILKKIKVLFSDLNKKNTTLWMKK
jgi:hypothetical protein